VNCQVTVVVAQRVGSGLEDIGVRVVDLSRLARLREAQKYLLDEILGIVTVMGSLAKEAQQWSVVATRKRIDRVCSQLIRSRLGFKVAQHGAPMTRATMGHGNRVVKVTETAKKMPDWGSGFTGSLVLQRVKFWFLSEPTAVGPDSWFKGGEGPSCALASV
jgi:hypothetical protein